MNRSTPNFLLIFVTILLVSQIIYGQQPTEKTYAFQLASGSFVTFVAGGGLDTSGKALTPKQVFAVADINGGEIEDGDKIKIRVEASVWHEDKDGNKINRVAIKGSNESETIFKIKKKGKSLLLQTATGKFVTVDGGGAAALTTTDKEDMAAVFNLVVSAPPPAPQSYTVGLRLVSGTYLSTVAGGGLSANAADLAAGQVFTVIDTNGGTLNDGDTVKILWQMTYWHEDKDNNKMHRVPVRGAPEAECSLKMRVKGRNILLETASGRFITAAPDGLALLTTDKRDEASLLEAVPAPPPPPAKP